MNKTNIRIINASWFGNIFFLFFIGSGLYLSFNIWIISIICCVLFISQSIYVGPIVEAHLQKLKDDDDRFV